MIILLSQGGLGNQLFQYSALLFLRYIISHRIKFDPYSFHAKNDKLYARPFSLTDFTHELLISPLSAFLFKIVYKFITRFFYSFFTRHTRLSFLTGIFIVNDKNFQQFIKSNHNYNLYFCMVIFSSQKYPFICKVI